MWPFSKDSEHVKEIKAEMERLTRETRHALHGLHLETKRLEKQRSKADHETARHLEEQIMSVKGDRTRLEAHFNEQMGALKERLNEAKRQPSHLRPEGAHK